MKKLFVLLALLPFAAFGQKTDCQLDIYGCYVNTINALAKGTDGLANLHKQIAGSKTNDIYVTKQYFTINLPEKVDKLNIHYEDINEQATELYKQQQAKKTGLAYMTELTITSDTCYLWVMPVQLIKVDGQIEPDYPNKGCRMNFLVSKETGKLCFVNANCPPADKKD